MTAARARYSDTMSHPGNDDRQQAPPSTLTDRYGNADEGSPRIVNLAEVAAATEDRVYVAIVKDPAARGGMRYSVIEPTLSEEDARNLDHVRRILMTDLAQELASNMVRPQAGADSDGRRAAEEWLANKVAEIIVDNYRLEIDAKSLKKLVYYVVRDFARLGRIDVMMQDPMIEEISCSGAGVPLYVWHREYELMPTNVAFHSEKELADFAQVLGSVSGKSVSAANPILDAPLPDGSRMILTYGREVTRKGPTFTIKKYRSDPLTIIDLVKHNTMSSDMAAYLWYLVEKRLTALVAGGNTSGKTTTINALAAFIAPDQKVITIEDIPQLNLLHENWIPAVMPAGNGEAVAAVTRLDLIRMAVRQRPDVIIVSETAGPEAPELFDALTTTSSGGFSSIRADSVGAAITRLTSPPMGVPKVGITGALDIVLLQMRMPVGNRHARRVIQLSEVAGYDDKTGEILLNDAFRWNPVGDKHLFTGKSIMFDKISERFGESLDQITYELNRRKAVIEWMLKKNIRSHRDVYATIKEFYRDPGRFYERIRIAT